MKRSTITEKKTYEDIHSPLSIISRRGLFSLSYSLNEGIERNAQICAKLSKHARLISPDKKTERQGSFYSWIYIYFGDITQ